jgi:hypothetical protein
LQKWQDVIDSSLKTKAEVAGVILDSAEFQSGAAAITRLYLGALQRAPDAAGLNHFMQQHSSGNTLSQMGASVVASSEFTGKYGTPDNGALIDQLYLNVLGRSADADGKAYWNSRITTGLSLGEVVAGFTESTESIARTDAKVSLALDYLGLLGRTPDANGYSYWLSEQQAGLSEVNIIGTFMSSAEYHDRFLPPSA